jgi:hypothetical protein
MQNFYEVDFLKSFGMTIGLEITVLLILFNIPVLRKSPEPKPANHKVILAGFFCTFATLPWLWFVLPAFVQDRFWYTLVGEVSIFLIEGVMLYLMLPLNILRAILYSFLANLVSWGLGVLF